MKRSTLAFVTAATLIATVACAKKEHKNPAAKPNPQVDNPADTANTKALEAARIAQGKQSPTRQTAPFNPDPAIKAFLNQPYKGPLLELKYVKEDPEAAVIELQNEDAKNLYQALRLEEEVLEENEVYLAGKTKNGESVRCSVTAKKSAAKDPEYKCIIPFDYSSGAATILTQGLKLDSKVAPLQKQYKGISLLLDPGYVEAPADPADADANVKMPTAETDSKTFIMEKQKPFPTVDSTASRIAGSMTAKPIGKLLVTGTDARIIYSLLQVPEVQSPDISKSISIVQKKGEHIACQKHNNDSMKEPQFVCRMSIDYATGVVTRLAPAQLPATE